MFAQSAVAIDVDIPITQFLVSSHSAPPVAPASSAGGAAASAAPQATKAVAAVPTTSVPLAAVPAAVPTTLSAAPRAALAVRTLQIGMFGPDVRALQDVLRAKGLKVSTDGAFGRGTAAAVRLWQKRIHLAPTGRADAKFQDRIGLQSRLAASAAPGATPTAPAGTIAPSTATGKYLKAFPLQGTGYRYNDDFGAGRHQGAHQGNDLMAPRGTTIVAVTDATVDRMTRVETGLGGIWVWLRDGAGTTYYFAHMDSIVDGLSPGSKLKAGQVIGAVGNTGDARYGSPHLHFEVHPGGGSAVSPFADLVALDPDPTAARKSR